MTTKPEPHVPEADFGNTGWPENVYVGRARNDQLMVSSVMPRPVSTWKEYVSADVAAAEKIAIIRATLEAAKKRILDYDFAAGAKNFALMLDDIDPATILNNMEKSK